jgi:phytol kinase
LANSFRLLFAAIVFPILHYAERWKGYAGLFNQRHPGEVKKSLLLLFCTHAAIIALCWGWLDKPYIAVTSILMWGVGDTFAALVGKRFGKHHVHLPLTDPKKTWEGSAAMMITAFAAGLIALLIASPLEWHICLAYAAVAAPVAAYTELISHGGNDTVTVPTGTALILILLSTIIR